MIRLLSRLNWRNLPLVTQLAILLVAMAIVPLVLVTLYNGAAHRDELLVAARERNILQAHNAADEIDEFLDDTLADLSVLARMPAAVEFLRDPQNAAARDELALIFDETRRAHTYRAILLTDQAGRVLFAMPTTRVGQSYLTTPAFQSAIAGNTAFDEPHSDPLEDVPHLHFSAPVRANDGVVLGTLIGGLPMTRFDELARTRLEYMGRGSFGLLWNDAGILLSDTAHPERRFRPLAPLPADVLAKMIAEERWGPETRERLTAPLNHPQLVERSREVLYDATADAHVRGAFGDEVTSHGAIAPLHGKRWVYGVFTSEPVIFAELDAQTNRSLQTALLVSLIAIASAVLGARWWARPLRRVTDTVHARAAGEMTRRVGMTTGDEVGQLATAFDAMADALADQDRQLRAHAAELEQRVAERTAALSASEERYRTLVQVSPDAISMIAANGTILFCNDQLAHIHGYASADELIGLNAIQLVAKQDRQRIIDSAQKLARERGVSTLECTLLKKDGTQFPAELRWTAMRGEGDKTSATIGVTRDITLRKQAEAQRQLQVTALQAAANGIVITDTRGTIQWCNDAFVAMTGYAMDEAIGKDPRDLIWSGKQAREFYRDLWDTVLAGRVWCGQLVNRRKDGGEYTEEMTITPVRADGADITHLVAIKQDVTARQRAEEEIRRRVAYQAALNAIFTAAVESAANLDAVLNVALDEILRALDAPIGGVWVVPTNGHARAFAIRGVPAEFEQVQTQMHALSGMAYEQFAVVNDWNRVEHPVAQTMRQFGFHASLLVPLRAQGKTIGGLSVCLPQPHGWTEEETTFMRTVGQQLGIVIERVRLFDDAELRAEQFGLLYQAGLTVNRSLDSRAQLESLCQTARQAVHADHVGVFLIYPAEEMVQFEFGVGLDLNPSTMPTWAFRVGEERGIVGLVAKTGAPVYVPDVTQDPRWIKHGTPVRSGMWIPLVHEDAVRGVIVVTSLAENAFTAQDEKLLTLFASQISVAMENARLYQEAVSAAERHDVLHWASQEIISAGMDLERVYIAIHRAAAQLMPCEAFVIGLRDEAHAENVAVYLIDRGGRSPVIRTVSDQGLMGQVIPTGKPVLIDDLPADNEFIHFGDEARVRAVLAVPLRAGARVTGMLSVQSYRPHVYTADDQVLLEMLAAHAAGVLENARLFEETRRRLAALEALSRISTALRAAQSLDQMMAILLDETLSVLHAHAATIWLYDPAKNQLVQAAARGFPADTTPLKPGEGIAGQVFVSGQVYLSSDFKNDPRTSAANRTRVPDRLRGAAVPIRTAQDSIGVLFVSVQEPHQLSEDQVYILTTLAEMAGSALHRQRLHNQTQRRLDQVQALRTVDMAITSSMDLDVTLSILLERAMMGLGMDGADILAFNPHLHAFEFRAGRGLGVRDGARVSVRLGEELAGTAALERRVFALADVSAYISRQASAPMSTLTRHLQTEFGENLGAYYAAPLIAKGQIKGVLELFHRTPRGLDADGQNFLEAIANQAAIAMDNAQLFHDLERSNVELALAYDTTIEGWSRTLDLRDEETEGHTQRVTELTVRLARAMGLDDAELVNVRRGALLHDIGKMGVPDQILLKPGPLTDAEWELMRRHPLYAYQLLAPIKFLGRALDIPYCHHERWDGAGYPRGLKGEQIPLTARIFAVVDVWDALTSDRPYRPAWETTRVREYLLAMSGKQFDPQVVAAFVRLMAW
ncbi:MAG: GAF domain-containing protein [Chloroflexi bacterium]|nr:GAF domain-containing protein [Chloroflexota bacterium]